MQIAKVIAFILVASTAVGCSSKYAVTFDSVPQGATLICNGTNWGYTPKTLYYDQEVKSRSSLNLGSCSANWVSGAKQYYGTIPVQQFPDGVKQTLQRPNTPGYEKDAEFELKAKQMEYQRRQAEAAEDAAYQAQRQNNKSVNCYTTFGMTRCY